MKKVTKDLENNINTLELITELGKSYAKTIRSEFNLNDYDIKVYHTINSAIIPELLDMCDELCDDKAVSAGFKLALSIISAADAALRDKADEALAKTKELAKKRKEAREEIDIKINGGTISGKKAEKVIELLKELGIDPEEE